MGSDKINVVPPEVWAELDCRLLPDQDPEAWLAEMGEVLGPEVEIEMLMGFRPAVSSTDTELYRTLKEVTLENFPGAPFVPQVQGGFTDSHFFRDLGIVCYGYRPRRRHRQTPAASTETTSGSPRRTCAGGSP